MNNFEPIVTIATAIVGVAIIAILISKKSNTAGVFQAAGSAFSNALGVAVSPVTGSQTNLDLSYPGSAGGGLTMPNFNSLTFGLNG